MQQSGGGRGGADEVVAQQRGPEFAADHLGRLAMHVVQVQRLLDRADVEFRVPAEPDIRSAMSAFVSVSVVTTVTTCVRQPGFTIWNRISRSVSVSRIVA